MPVACCRSSPAIGAGRPGQSTERTPSGVPDVPNVCGIRRVAYVLSAALLVALGFIGLFLPGLPTTPFLLVASWLLAQSSPRLNRRLLESRLLGPALRSWQQHRAVSRRVKCLAVGMVMAAVGVMLFSSSLRPLATAAVCLAAALGLVVIYRLPVTPAV